MPSNKAVKKRYRAMILTDAALAMLSKRLSTSSSRTLADAMGLDYKTAKKVLDQGGNDIAIFKIVFEKVGLVWNDTYAVGKPLSAANNLPAATDTIGRGDDVETIKKMLEQRKFVSLTGPGGIGKTHLALSVARELVNNQQQYPNGIWLVNLQLLNPGNTELLYQTIARVLNAPPEVDSESNLIKWLSNKQLILILDNCEHLRAKCASFLDSLLANCFNVKILTTSVSSLNVNGEQNYLVPALELPSSPEGLDESDAGSGYKECVVDSMSGTLFIHEAKLKKHDYELYDNQAKEVFDLLHFCEGNPLWIKLAAAQINHGTAELLNNMKHMLSGSPGSSTLQMSLDNMMDWVLDILNKEPKAALLLSRLSIFEGGWTIDAAKSVCSDQTDINENEIGIIITTLIDWNLIVAPDSESRYVMLEPIRIYAQGKLAQSDKEQLQVSMLQYYTSWTMQEVSGLMTSAQSRILSRIGSEIHNLSVCLRHSKPENRDNVLRLAVSLTPFWDIRGYWLEAYSIISSLIIDVEKNSCDSILHAVVYVSAGIFAMRLRKFTESNENFIKSKNLLLKLLSKSPDELLSISPGNLYSIPPGDSLCLGYLVKVYNNLASVAQESGDFNTEIDYYLLSIQIKQILGDSNGVAVSRINIGYSYYLQSLLDKAAETLELGISELNKNGDSAPLANAHNNLGGVYRLKNDKQKALIHLKLSLGMRQRLKDKRGLVYSIYEFAQLLNCCEKFEESTQLIAQVEWQIIKLGSSFPSAEQVRMKKLLTFLEEKLGNERYILNCKKGKKMSLTQAANFCADIDTEVASSDRDQPI